MFSGVSPYLISSIGIVTSVQSVYASDRFRVYLYQLPDPGMMLKVIEPAAVVFSHSLMATASVFIEQSEVAEQRLTESVCTLRL